MPPSGRAERPAPVWLSRNGLPFAVALAITWLAYDGGGYALGVRTPAAIAVWVAIAVGVGVAFLPQVRPSREAIVVGALLAAFALLQLLSATWGDSTEKALLEFDRVVIYLGVFALVVLAAREGSAHQWAHGLALGIAAIGVIALSSRLFPDLFGPSDIEKLNPGDPRLSYPVNYWNGLSVLLALGIPLLLNAAVQARGRVPAALAIAPVPVLVTAMYLTSSRGGAVAALVGLGAFVVLTPRRVPLLAAAAIAAVGSALAVVSVRAQDELANGPLDSDAVAGQGRTAAVLIVIACALTAAAWAFARRLVPERVHVTTTQKRVAVASAAVLLVAAVVAADPASRFEDLKKPPEIIDARYVSTHITSTSGNGRWQFWSAAVDEFESDPLLGGGAGSYAAWWAQHGTLDYFTRNAHSLVLETLGELGAIGFLLLLALIGSGLFLAVRRVRGSPDESKPVVAALAAAFLAFVLGVATDWMWDLTVIAVIGIACLGLLVGPASVFPPRATPARFSLARARDRLGWRVATAAGVVVLVVAQAIPLMTERKIRDSQDTLKAGDADGALAAAHDASDIQPWAASARLQVALVEEYDGKLADARETIDEAIDRDPSDWQLWLVASRIDERRGDLAAARETWDHARSLNPRSPVFKESERP